MENPNGIEQIIKIVQENKDYEHGLGDLCLMIHEADKGNLRHCLCNNNKIVNHAMTVLQELLIKHNIVASDK